jgi:hypothetical protein
MPFVYDETQLEWPEDDDDFEPPPPRPDQFVYIPPPDFGGASAPVRFSVVAEPDETATGSNGPPTRSIWNRLLGWWRPSKEEERRRGWASMLLGEGFGTGEYSMYGAFTVDLETCAITDNRNADPIVENIQIAT